MMHRAKLHREGARTLAEFFVSSERAAIDVYAETLMEMNYVTETQRIALDQCCQFLAEQPLPKPRAVAYIKPKRIGRINQVKNIRGLKMCIKIMCQREFLDLQAAYQA